MALSSLFDSDVFHLTLCSKCHTQAQRSIHPRLVLSAPSFSTIWPNRTHLASGMRCTHL